MALELREAIGALTEGGAVGGMTLASGSGLRMDLLRLALSASRADFDYAAIGTVSNVASRLCDEAKPGQILISPRVLTKVENAIKGGMRP